MNKSAEVQFKERLDRALNQRMFLLSHNTETNNTETNNTETNNTETNNTETNNTETNNTETNNTETNEIVHNFLVEGYSSKQYAVILNKECVSCNCIDFIKRKKICKHIMFVICRIYKKNLYDDDPNIDMTDIIDSNKVPESIFKQLAVGDCAICFESTDNSTKCTVCTNGIYHKECIKIWLRINNNCPMCRSIWTQKPLK